MASNDDVQIERIDRVARLLYDYAAERQLLGACHELSALGYVLLREQGVDVELCIGVAHSRRSPFLGVAGIDFDHSWLEVLGGEPLDIACAAPHPPAIPVAPVIAGLHVDDGRPSDICYGVPGTLDEPAARVARETLGQYVEQFDRADSEQSLWENMVGLGKSLGLALDVDGLRSRYAGKRWVPRKR
jgi:hypothetical protein